MDTSSLQSSIFVYYGNAGMVPCLSQPLSSFSYAQGYAQTPTNILYQTNDILYGTSPDF